MAANVSMLSMLLIVVTVLLALFISTRSVLVSYVTGIGMCMIRQVHNQNITGHHGMVQYDQQQ